jgi:gliding motility-associated-like protein
MDSTITFCVPITDAQGNGPYSATIGCADNGTASAVVTGNTVCITFVPNAGYVGTDSLCLIVCDGVNSCDTSNIIIVITPPGNIPPVAIPDYITTKVSTSVIIPIAVNDYDPDGTLNLSSIVLFSNAMHGSVLFQTDGTALYTPETGYVGTDTYVYRIFDNDMFPLSDTAIVTITITQNELNIPNGFSPDLDGINESFVIRGLEGFPNASLSIYNRWGNLVYQKTPYDNLWDGKSNVDGIFFGSDLPEGTYFYLLDLGDGNKAMNGYVILKR